MTIAPIACRSQPGSFLNSRLTPDDVALGSSAVRRRRCFWLCADVWADLGSRTTTHPRRLPRSAQLWATAAAPGKATLDAERALQTGRLTIVDAPCWEAMGAAYVALNSLRRAMAARVDAPEMRSADEIVRYVEGIRLLADRYNDSILALVIAAADRVSPAETVWNRRRRRAARRRLGERFGSAADALQHNDKPPQSQHTD